MLDEAGGCLVIQGSRRPKWSFRKKKQGCKYIFSKQYSNQVKTKIPGAANC